jgi:hypothetical protein
MPDAEGGFGSLADVRALFGNEGLLLAGWVHYLAFDLFVGAVEVRLSNELRISHLIMLPVLIATFMLGPIGLLAFFIVKSARERKLAEVTG